MTSILPARPVLRGLSVSLVGAACLLFMAADAIAAVSLGGTRVVIGQHTDEGRILASNEGDQPQLIQVWVDDGQPGARPDDLDMPIVAVPVISRLEPKASQWLRLKALQDQLPNDRESVYWLNVLAVPPKAPPTSDVQARLQFAVRTRIKIFHRPTGLQGTPADTPAQIRWSIAEQDGSSVLVGHNPTPYSLSVAQVGVVDGNVVHSQGPAIAGGGGMIAPFQSTSFPLGAPGVALRNGMTVRLQWVNDQGGYLALDAIAGR